MATRDIFSPTYIFTKRSVKPEIQLCAWRGTGWLNCWFHTWTHSPRKRILHLRLWTLQINNYCLSATRTYINFNISSGVPHYLINLLKSLKISNDAKIPNFQKKRKKFNVWLVYLSLSCFFFYFLSQNTIYTAEYIFKILYILKCFFINHLFKK